MAKTPTAKKPRTPRKAKTVDAPPVAEAPAKTAGEEIQDQFNEADAQAAATLSRHVRGY